MTITSLIAPSRERKYKQPQRATVRHLLRYLWILRKGCMVITDKEGGQENVKSMLISGKLTNAVKGSVYRRSVQQIMRPTYIRSG